MQVCAACGEENPERARFCLACAEPFRAAAPDAAGERRRVTVLFADLVGFTAISETRDPEAVRSLVDHGMSALGEVVEHYGGIVDKVIGDALMAVFGAPFAHEDDATRAVLAGLEMQRLAERRELFAGLPMRVGINTGDVIFAPVGPAARRSFTVMGDAVNVASRLQALAPIGGVAVGESTYRRTRAQVEYSDIGRLTVKGKADPIPVWHARETRRADSAAKSAPQTPFVGRDLELATLARLYGRAVDRRTLELVTVVAEPGGGKSRLIRELGDLLASHRRRPSWRQSRCLPYGEGIVFGALGRLFQAELGIDAADPPSEADAKLAAGVERLLADPSEAQAVAARLAPLVGGSSESGAAADRPESFASWMRFIRAMAADRPLVLVIEDLHWADRALIEFLEELVEKRLDASILVVCSARPELVERRPGWGRGKTPASTLPLAPLHPSEVARLIEARLPALALDASTKQALLERAGGNPLYAEEFAALVAETSSPGAAVVSVPETVQALIAARLDALSPMEKQLLQAAAVVGERFRAEAVGVVTAHTLDDVQSGLGRLLSKELVRRVGGMTGERPEEYAFWHILVRDVVYDQIPRRALVAKHRAVADWMGTASPRGGDWADSSVYHYERARGLALESGDHVACEQMRAPLRDAFGEAGKRALQLDVATSEAHYRNALRLCKRGEEQRCRLLVEAAEAALVAGRFEIADQWFEEAIGEFREQGDSEREAEAMVRLARSCYFQAKADTELELLERALALLEGRPPGEIHALAYERMAGYSMLHGLTRECLCWSERALSIAERVGLDEQRVRALELRGIARCEVGDAGGMRDLERAVGIGIETGLGEETCRSYGNLGEWLWLREGPAAGMRAKSAGIEYGDRRGLDLPARWHAGETLWTMFDAGTWDELVRVADELIAWDDAREDSAVGIMARTWKSRVALEREDIPLCRSLCDAVVDLARGAHAQLALPAMAAAAAGAAADGQGDEAVRRVLDMEAFCERRPAWRGRHLVECVRACFAADAPQVARRLIAACEPCSPRDEHCLRTARAILAEASADPEKAGHLYASAAAAWEAFGHPLETGLAHLGQARCGTVRTGLVPLAAAEDVFRRLGATRALEQAQAVRAAAA